eukprot:Colp12_sorted_trinity150504_noHs@27030
MDDKDTDLDDLLESALEDFDKKVADDILNNNTDKVASFGDGDQEAQLEAEKIEKDLETLLSKLGEDPDFVKTFEEALNQFGSIEGEEIPPGFEGVSNWVEMFEKFNMNDLSDEDEAEEQVAAPERSNENKKAPEVARPKAESDAQEKQTEQQSDKQEEPVKSEQKQPAPAPQPKTEEEKFEEAIRKAMGGLEENAKRLGDLGDDDMFANMEQEFMKTFGAAGGASDVVPAMEKMMEALLGKEAIYQPLKEMCNEYPRWLSEHAGTLPASEVERLQGQFAAMQELCAEYEREGGPDYSRTLDLMQKMQVWGTPPEDIVGKVAPGMKLDENVPPMAPGADQCCVM